MNKISPFVDGLIEAFQCLPGVGPKSARRMVLHLLEKDREAGKVLAESLELTLSNVGPVSYTNMTLPTKRIV